MKLNRNKTTGEIAHVECKIRVNVKIGVFSEE
jgi:hypothetical protein